MNTHTLLVAYDIGTSGVKGSLYTEKGMLIYHGTSGYETFYDGYGGAEQRPKDWWEAIKAVTSELMRYAAGNAISCVSFSGQESGLVLIGQDGQVLRNSMIHCDMRAVKENDRILSWMDDMEFFEITGHKASPSYPLEKLLWVKENEPAIYARIWKVLNAKDYIVYKMTGKVATDYTDASFTNLYDINLRDWSDRICTQCGIDRAILPEIKPSTWIAGYVDQSVSDQMGLPVGTAVVLGAGDGQCATVGCGAVRPGKTYNCLGSSSWITTILEKPPRDSGMCLETAAHPAGPWANAGGTMQTAGACWDWAVHSLYPHALEEEVENELSQTSPGSGGVLFLPYLNGERVPFWDSHARGTFTGISATTTRGDMLRAVLEGVAFNLGLILLVVRRYTDVQEITVFGGMAKNTLFCQILADVYGIPVVTLKHADQITSLGAAVIGGVGAGLFPDFSIAEELCQNDRIYMPVEENVRFYANKPVLLSDAYHALRDIFRRLAPYNRI